MVAKKKPVKDGGRDADYGGFTLHVPVRPVDVLQSRSVLAQAYIWGAACRHTDDEDERIAYATVVCEHLGLLRPGEVFTPLEGEGGGAGVSPRAGAGTRR